MFHGREYLTLVIIALVIIGIMASSVVASRVLVHVIKEKTEQVLQNQGP